MTLYSIILGMECENVAEFGSGFSTKCIFEALKITEGRLVTFEQISKHQNEKWFSNEMMSAQEEKWRFVQGNSLQTVPAFEHNPYDVVLHDGSHTASEVTVDIDNILPHIKSGGLLLLHDTSHYDLGADMLNGIENSNIKNYNHELLTLPFGYGLTIIRLLESKNKEEVKITWRKGNY
jgi:predicted O-methyltransferase YrrM